MLKTEEPQTSRREQAKTERRDRIVEATYALLREVGSDALSVKMVAARAEVSAATVYNLFGTKGAILARVFDIDLANFEKRVAQARSADALDAIFDAIAIAANLYREDPGFYRATMWMRPAAPEDSGLVAAMREPRTRFWRGMIQHAIDEGHLRVDNAAPLGVLFIQISAGALSDWVAGTISVEQLERETGFGFAVVLSSFATREAKSRLRARMAAYMRDLSTSSRAD